MANRAKKSNYHNHLKQIRENKAKKQLNHDNMVMYANISKTTNND